MSLTLDGEQDDRIRNQAQLLDTPNQAVIGTTTEGVITYWSRGACWLYGWDASEVMGRDILEVTPSPLVRHTAAEIMARLKSGSSWKGKFQVQARNGTEFTASVQNFPVSDTQGRLIGIIGVSRPVD